MDVIVNGTPLLAPRTGIGQYIWHLFSAMEEISSANIRMYYGTHCAKGMKLPGDATTKAVQRTYGALSRLLPRPRTLRRVAERAVFAFHTRQGLSNVLYHEPNFVPLPYRGPLVLTVHDLSCFDHPETHPQERVRFMHEHMPKAIEKADHIIVVSDASGKALERWFHVDPKRITTTLLAADARYVPRSTSLLEPALNKLGLSPGCYILSVGTLEPRKNLKTLFAAYALLPAGLRKRYPLVIAGMTGWHAESFMSGANDLLARGELRLLGYVPDDVMPLLYAGASVFCYPSLYEGFGLPVLEAMASGVPVVTGNRTSLPEVVGDAGMMVDPEDVEGMRDQIQQLLEDRSIAETFGQLGVVRSQTFSWNRCAQETYSVYQMVLRQRGILQ